MSAVIATLEGLCATAMLRDQRWAAPRIAELAQRLRTHQPCERLQQSLVETLTRSNALVATRSATALHIAYPDLPVAARRDDIIASLRAQPLLVLTGETGSGKTTQLPKMLLDCGLGRRGRIALTQPRRLAATAVAARLREELQCSEPAVVHAVRFDDRCRDDTLIEVCTDGLLLAKAARDPDFTAYDAVIVDEAHERSLTIDVLLGLLAQAQRRRPDLRLIISSATIEAQRFSTYLGGCPVISVQGRAFPVAMRWAPPQDDDIGYVDAAVSAIRELHAGQLPGSGEIPVEEASGVREARDILCFLPTERDILETAKRLSDMQGAHILPLFGRLTPSEQQRIFAPLPGRKVVLATPIAETSLTVPGIRYVVDSGLARSKRFHAASRTERLPIEAISQANAVQRAGRAGRIAPGVCVRLYAAEDFAQRAAAPTPEILRANLAGALLTCLAGGMSARTFPWPDPPSDQAWDQAEQILDELGAIDDQGRLTAIGRTLAALPCDPHIGRMLLAGAVDGVAADVCTIAAFLSIQDPRVRPLGSEAKADAAHRAFADPAGDLISVLKLWAAWEDADSASRRRALCTASYLGFRRMREWADVRHHLWGTLREHHRGALSARGSAVDAWPVERIHRCVLSGMLGQVMVFDREARGYRATANRVVAVHPGSVLHRARSDAANDAEPSKKPSAPPWLMACEVVETSRLYARLCAAIDPEWIVALAGDRLKRSYRNPHYHAQRQQVVAHEALNWKGLCVRDGRLVPYATIDGVAATALFIDQGLCADEVHPGMPEVVAANLRVLRTAQALRDRSRDAGITVARDDLVRWWTALLAGSTVASIRELKSWIAAHGVHAAQLRLSELVAPALAERCERDFPATLRIGGQQFSLRYRFAPGEDDDGATLTMAREQVAWLTPEWLDACVPGWLPERVHALLQQLPKDDRRTLIPLAEHAARLSAELAAELGRSTVAQALIAALRTRGIHARFDDAALPAWLRLRVRVVEPDRSITDYGHDHHALFGQSAAISDRLRPLRSDWDTRPAATWPGELPDQVRIGGLVGYVGLQRDRDARGLVAARRAVSASRVSRDVWHDDGVEALAECHARTRIDAAAATLSTVSPRFSKHFAMPAAAAQRALCMAQMRSVIGAQIRDAAAWEHACRAIDDTTLGVDAAWFNRLCDRVESLRNRLRQGTRSLTATSVFAGAAQDLDRLCAPTVWSRLSWPLLGTLDTIIDAIAQRMEAAQRGEAGARRAHDRTRQLLDAVQASIGDAPRLLIATGHQAAARALWSLCEATCAALSSQRAAGSGEGQVLQQAHALSLALETHRDRIASTRAMLIEHAGYLPRIRDANARNQLGTELGERTRDFPDLGLGCDLDDQHAGALALCQRVRAAL